MRTLKRSRLIPLALLALAVSTHSFAQDFTPGGSGQGAETPAEISEIKFRSLYLKIVKHSENPARSFRQLAKRYEGQNLYRYHSDQARRKVMVQEIRRNSGISSIEMVELIRSALRSRDTNLIVFALGVLGDEAIQSGQIPRGVADARGGQGPQTLDVFIPSIVPLLGHRALRVRQLADGLMANYAPSGVYVPALIKLLQHKNPDVCAMAINDLNEKYNLFQINPTYYNMPTRGSKPEERLLHKSLPKIVKLLRRKDLDRHTRGEVAYLITFASDASGQYAPEIAALLRDPGQQTKQSALHCLYRIQDLPEECGPPLLQALLGNSFVYRSNIGRSGPNYERVVAVAIGNLGMNAKSILPELKKATRFGQKGAVRRRAKLALEYLEPHFKD